MKFQFGYDDALDVVGVHLVGGLVGSLLLGLFADRAFNPAVVHQGVFVNGSWELMGDQLVAVGATLVWSGVLTFVILKVLAARDPRRAPRLRGGRGDRSRPHPALRGGLLTRPGLSAARAGAGAVRHDGSSRMKLIVGIIKPFKLDDVKDAIKELGIQGLTVSDVQGFGRQRGPHRGVPRARSTPSTSCPRCASRSSSTTVTSNASCNSCSTTANTGKIGDGKVWVVPLENVWRIRTGESGPDAL